MNKEITLARHAGFCYGVKRAVDTVKKIKLENPDKNVFILGELIHNLQVIKELDSLGIKTVDEIPQNTSGVCVIRSHGASPSVFEDIKKSGLEIVDLTCTDVKKVQHKAIELIQEGYYLIIVGKSEHPEVVAIKANAQAYGDKILVATEKEQLEPYKEALKLHKKVGIVVQTTQRVATLTAIVDYLIPFVKDLRIANTICASTSLRQNEAKKMAEENDLMIVVGSKRSANTTHLAEILTEITKTIHIETDAELDNYSDLINNAHKIGITAGASTPDFIITNVVNNLKERK